MRDAGAFTRLKAADDGFEKMFEGPEIQYFELGELGAAPGSIAVAPVAPVMTVDIEFANAIPGDQFHSA